MKRSHSQLLFNKNFSRTHPNYPGLKLVFSGEGKQTGTELIPEGRCEGDCEVRGKEEGGGGGGVAGSLAILLAPLCHGTKLILTSLTDQREHTHTHTDWPAFTKEAYKNMET